MSRSKPQFIAAKASGGNGGQCVEVSIVPGSESPAPMKSDEPFVVLVRDSKDPDGPVLAFTVAEWDAFLDGAAKGEFKRERLLAMLPVSTS